MPKVKLGMTVQPPKKSPYDKMGKRMLEGQAEEDRLEGLGRRLVGKTAAKSQGRIPKAKPMPGGGRRGRA